MACPGKLDAIFLMAMLILSKFGYWGGISPTGKISKKYKIREVRKRDNFAGGTMTVVDADDAELFYDDFYL